MAKSEGVPKTLTYGRLLAAGSDRELFIPRAPPGTRRALVLRCQTGNVYLGGEDMESDGADLDKVGLWMSTGQVIVLDNWVAPIFIRNGSETATARVYAMADVSL